MRWIAKSSEAPSLLTAAQLNGSECTNRLVGDVVHACERPVGRHREHAHSAVEVSRHEQVGGAADHRRRHDQRAVECQRRVVADVVGCYVAQMPALD